MSATKKNKFPKIVYLGLGSNIDPGVNISRAISELKHLFTVIEISNLWETPPVGSKGPIFLNGVVTISTELSYGDLKTRLREIERNLGRVRTADKNAPRTIDLDILIYNGEVLDQDIWSQAYLAVPLADVHSELTNPENGETIKDIAERLRKS